NAYDDGLSTGRLRGFVPGMLGASDFRKNLSQLLELSSPVQFAVADLLEYRFPAGSPPGVLASVVLALDGVARRGRIEPPVRTGIPDALAAHLAVLDRETAAIFHAQLAAFEAYATTHASSFSMDDCALGNLLLAGAYAANGRSFNAAVAQLSLALRCRAEVL